MSQGKQNSLLSLAVPVLPPTVNHLYESAGANRYLTKEYRLFKQMVWADLGARAVNWKPRGAVMVLIFLQSPFWVTKKGTMRDMDGDNRVKALLDAIKDATKVPDYTNWEIHVWKAASAKVRTTTYLFDLGDVVPWFP